MEIWVANFLKTRRTMEGIKVKLPKLPEISFAKQQCPRLPAYQEFLKAKTFEVCRAAGATEALIWWAMPIIAPPGGPVLIILSVARFAKVRATESIISRFGCGVRNSLLGPPMLGCIVGRGRLIPLWPRLSARLLLKGPAPQWGFFGNLKVSQSRRPAGVVCRIWSLVTELHKGIHPHIVFSSPLTATSR